MRLWATCCDGRKRNLRRANHQPPSSIIHRREGGTTAEDAGGVGEALDDTLRAVLTVAAQLGERAARLRDQAVRQAEARADQQTRELAARHDAERAADAARSGGLVAAADRAERRDRDNYDAGARRDDFRTALRAPGIGEDTVAARILADEDNA